MNISRIKKNQGFTLVEIIIVIIILGILAAVALPALTKNLDTSKGAEALGILGASAASVRDCYGITEDMTKCNDWNDAGGALNDTKPDMTIRKPAAGRFTYVWSGGTAATDPSVLTATLTGGQTADTIAFTFNTNGSVGKAFGGVFTKLNK